MLNLVPVENWEYALKDFIRILFSELIKNKFNKYKFLHIPGLGECIPTRSGRVGLITALNALKLQKKAKIGVPLFCCPIVFKAVEAANCIPHFIDVDTSTFCISPDDLYKKRNEIDALIAVHMFGNTCDMQSLLKICSDKPIIEDCAQSLGSYFYGKSTGSFGTVSIFSFRSGKYLSAGEGGAIFSKDSNIFSRLFDLINEMPTPKIMDEYIHILITYLRSLIRRKPLYGLIGTAIWSFYNKTIDYLDQSPIIFSKIYKSDLEIIKLRILNLESIIKRQRLIADYYLNTLKLDSNMLCFEKPGAFFNRYLFPILFNSLEERDFIAKYLKLKQIDVIKPYKDVVKIAKKYYGYNGGCPVSEKIAEKVLIIPSHYKLKLHEVKKIVHYLNEGWKIIKGKNYD